MIKAIILSTALYFSFVLIVQVTIQLIKAHGVNIMKAAGYEQATAQYKDHTALASVTAILWGLFYYVTL
jgi:hypothetical protein